MPFATHLAAASANPFRLDDWSNHKSQRNRVQVLTASNCAPGQSTWLKNGVTGQGAVANPPNGILVSNDTNFSVRSGGRLVPNGFGLREGNLQKQWHDCAAA